MANNDPCVSALSRGLLTNEDWDDLVSWDEELYDPLFQSDVSFTGTDADYGEGFTSDYHISESFPSAAAFVIDKPSSDYAVSAPPSVTEGHSSIGQTYSWLSNSPSFSTTATSPLVGRNQSAYQGSFNACNYAFPPTRTTESPILDTRQEKLPHSFVHSSSFQNVSPFNPYIAGSPHAFSSLDVSASFAFSNLGTWADQPQVEPITELDHTGAIPIPSISFQGLSNTFSSTSWPESEELQQEQPCARAITIPQPSRRAASYNPAFASSQWGTRQTHSTLSVSPEFRRHPKSVALSRSISRSEPRRPVIRNSLTTTSPISNTFGWVAYQPCHETKRLVPSGTEGKWGRRQRGRTKGLTAEQRRNAAVMRVVGSCTNCKKRKAACDPGIPCKSCLEHYKGGLIHFPCRDRHLSDLSRAFLSDRLGWHPVDRALESFISPNSFNTATDCTYIIPLNIGFGPPLHLPVYALQIEDSNALYHDHVVYSWPPSSTPGDIHTHAVLPAVLTPEAVSTLPEALNTHLSLLVSSDQHFRSFPLYCSPLQILREIYVFYSLLPPNTPSSLLLHQALKLLALVHIGGDLTLPPPPTNPTLAHLLHTTMPKAIPHTTPTPCFIRAQLGPAMPTLAHKLMNNVLSSLEILFLTRDPTDWPLALATLLVVLMTIESIQYHAAKVAYHHAYDRDRDLDMDMDINMASSSSPSSSSNTKQGPADVDAHRTLDDHDIQSLLAFYASCFESCHARLSPTTTWHSGVGPTAALNDNDVGGGGGGGGGGTLNQKTPGDGFVERVCEAVGRAGPGLYLDGKARETRAWGGGGEDMAFFFDRLVARVLLLRV